MFVVQYHFYNNDDGHHAAKYMIGPYVTEDEAKTVKSDLEDFFPRLEFIVSRLNSPTEVLQELRKIHEGRSWIHNKPETPWFLDEEATVAAGRKDYARAVRLTQRAKELRENAENVDGWFCDHDDYDPSEDDS
ncbi:MAG: hypothetical protein WD898_00445 [Candidatus Paceibacterota bacterium]